jgi:hypothetical protein
MPYEMMSISFKNKDIFIYLLSGFGLVSFISSWVTTFFYFKTLLHLTRSQLQNYAQ